jgi:hypothetical protein
MNGLLKRTNNLNASAQANSFLKQTLIDLLHSESVERTGGGSQATEEKPDIQGHAHAKLLP